MTSRSFLWIWIALPSIVCQFNRLLPAFRVFIEIRCLHSLTSLPAREVVCWRLPSLLLRPAARRHYTSPGQVCCLKVFRLFQATWGKRMMSLLYARGYSRDISERERESGVQSVESFDVGEPSGRTGAWISGILELSQVEYLQSPSLLQITPVLSPVCQRNFPGKKSQEKCDAGYSCNS